MAGSMLEDGRQIVEVADTGAWRRWLSGNHAESDPVWVAVSKKGGKVPAVAYADARDEALCWGWIDSTANRLDEHRYLILFARRKPNSGWSKVNKGRIEQLRKAGRMQDPGEAAISTAIENGSWKKLDAIEALEVPDDLADALKADPEAERGYESMPAGMKKQLLGQVVLAKRPQTRAKNVQQAVAAARERARRGGGDR